VHTQSAIGLRVFVEQLRALKQVLLLLLVLLFLLLLLLLHRWRQTKASSML
jgi:hypothetical protein